MGNKVNRSLCGIIIIAAALATITGIVDAQQKGLDVGPQESAGARLQQQQPGDPADCGAGCLRCEVVGCVKCRGVIVLDSRECREQCPSSHVEQWSTLVDYMGRLCTENTSGLGWLGSATSGLGGRGLAILVGAASGAAICIVLLLAGCGWVAYSRGKARRRSPPPHTIAYGGALVRNSDQWLTPQEAQERREFVKQVATLRPEAPVFLAMLNDTRRKVRQLYRPNGTDSRSKAYRTVLRDLSRLLTFLNRPEERLGAPPQDWPKLMAWAERSLRRYKKSCSSACSSGGASSASSTPSSSHALNQLQLPAEVQQTHSMLQLPVPPDYGPPPRHESIEVPALLQTSAEWSQAALVNGLYYDSSCFYPLGRRPQDEITTEL
ncbi:hypothetical protein B566_EDAN012092 [Ephemera danica]|nr:hypothetical protein B566_EDAN012092 [Ephemera danica]